MIVLYKCDNTIDRNYVYFLGDYCGPWAYFFLLYLLKDFRKFSKYIQTTPRKNFKQEEIIKVNFAKMKRYILEGTVFQNREYNYITHYIPISFDVVSVNSRGRNDQLST